MATDNEIERRRSKVAEAMAVGATYNEMASTFNVSVPTIARDVAAIKARVISEFEGKSGEEILIDIITKDRKLNRELWRIYERSSDEKVKNDTLVNILNLLDKKIKILQSIGKVKKAADTLEVTGGTVPVEVSIFAEAFKKHVRGKKDEPEQDD